MSAGAVAGLGGGEYRHDVGVVDHHPPLHPQHPWFRFHLTAHLRVALLYCRQDPLHHGK